MSPLTSSLMASTFRSSFIKDPGQVEEPLRWRNVNMSLKAKSKKAAGKPLLQNVWGEALPNQTTALMGPSGAGKTTLLNVLAGRVVPTHHVQVNADLRYGYANIETLPGGIQKFRQKIAFVPQEDVVNELSTPREAIRFSAKLRLPRSTSSFEIDLLVNDYLNKLGLIKCADTIIGGGLKKGISGGQKKRTCIGIELVTDPGIIFLDEPTSGLDAVSTEELMELLTTLARAGGNVVIFTIHQPSSSIFMNFDKLILLAEGKVMYQGPVLDVPNYFAKAGYTLPEMTNPADWVLKVAQKYSVEDLQIGGFFFLGDQRTYEESHPLRLSYYTPPANSESKPVPVWTQVFSLLTRELITLKRHPGPFLIDLLSNVFMGVISGISFYKVGSGFNSDDISSVWAVLIAVNTGYSMAIFAQAALRLSVMASQRHLFLKEYFPGTYTVGAYLSSSVIVEVMQTMMATLFLCIPSYFLLGLQYGFGWYYLVTLLVSLNTSSSAFLFGSFFSDPQKASAFFMIIVQPQINFTGMWASLYYIHPAARWLIYILFTRYSTAVTILLMFENCAKQDTSGSNACNELFVQDKVSPTREGLYWFGLIIILVATRLLGIIVFSRRARSFS